MCIVKPLRLAAFYRNLPDSCVRSELAVDHPFPVWSAIQRTEPQRVQWAVCQLNGIVAVSIHSPNMGTPCSSRDENDVTTIFGDTGCAVPHPSVDGQLPLFGSIGLHQPNVRFTASPKFVIHDPSIRAPCLLFRTTTGCDGFGTIRLSKRCDPNIERELPLGTRKKTSVSA